KADRDYDGMITWIINYLAGALRGLVIVIPIAVALSIVVGLSVLLGGGNRCGDGCGAIALALFLAVYVLAPYALAGIIFYIFLIFVSRATWLGNSAQYVGATTIVPILIGSYVTCRLFSAH